MSLQYDFLNLLHDKMFHHKLHTEKKYNNSLVKFTATNKRILFGSLLVQKNVFGQLV